MSETDPGTWLPVLQKLTGLELRTFQGLPVTLTGATQDGAVFTTRAGRVMPPVPLAEIARAVEHLQRGFDISQPWRIRAFARVTLESYVWALLHSEEFRDELRDAGRHKTGVPPITLGRGGKTYLLHAKFGAADPRPAAAGATWDDEEGAWRLDRNDENLRLARAAMSDQLPGAYGAERPYLVNSRRGLLLFSPFADSELVKSIPGARWLADERCWRFPLGAATVDALRTAFGTRLILSLDDRAGESTPEAAPQAEVAAEPVPEAVSEIAPAPPEKAVAPPETAVSTEPESAGAEERTVPDAAIEWLGGRPWLPAPSGESGWSQGARAAALVAMGRLDDGLARDTAPDSEPVDAALWLAATVCAAVSATSLTQLPGVEAATFEGIEPVVLSTLKLAWTADLPDPARANLAICGAAVGWQHPKLAQEILTTCPAGPERGRAAYVAAALGPREVSGFVAALAPEVVNELVSASTNREFADLALLAWANDCSELFTALMAQGFGPVVERGQCADVRREVLDLLDAASTTHVARLPRLANTAAQLLEGGGLAPPGVVSALEQESLYTTALRIALDFEDSGEISEAWLRLIRYYANRGELLALVEVARGVVQRPGLRVAAETAIAYAMAEFGEPLAAVEGLVAAAGRLRVAAPDDASALLSEAGALAAGDPRLEALVPQATAVPSVVALAAWPKETRVLVVGGNTALRLRGLRLLEDRDIPSDWVPSDSAERGDSLRGRVQGAGIVVLLTAHISHAIAYRVEDAAGAAGPTVLFYDRFGPAGLPSFLEDWSVGHSPKFRPKGT